MAVLLRYSLLTLCHVYVLSLHAAVGPVRTMELVYPSTTKTAMSAFARRDSQGNTAANRRVIRNRKHVPCFYRVIETRVAVWENKKCCGNTSRRRVFSQLFRVLPNFLSCFYNSLETRSTCFLFLLENTATRKRKTPC